jgi:hypothetical protein
MVIADKCPEQKEVDIFKNTPRNIEDIRITADPAKRSIIIESKAHLKEIFIADITGKILIRLESGEKQTKWNVDLNAYPTATFLVKYITADDQWGAEKFVLGH